MYVRKEAVLSSQIEGTQSTLSDLLRFETEAVSTPEPLRGELLTEEKLSWEFPHEAVSQAAASIRMYGQYSVPNLSMLQVTVGSPLFS
jgi:hypothetical protein